MRIIDRSEPAPAHTGYPNVTAYPDGTATLRCDDLQIEGSVRVFVNGEPTMTLMCSPDHIVELVVGRLYTEDMIDGIGDIDEIWLCEYATRVMVLLADRSVDAVRSHEEVVPTCCTGNRTLNSFFQRGRELAPLQPIAWDVPSVFALAERFKQDAPMHKQTFGAHSCYLARGAEVLYCLEDLGRHNAFDKVVGCALMDGVDLGQCTVFTSGRIPTDMASKAIRAGIPVMVSKAVPTDAAVEMACEYRLTLICSAHPDSFRVFNDPLGIVDGSAVAQMGRSQEGRRR